MWRWLPSALASQRSSGQRARSSEYWMPALLEWRPSFRKTSSISSNTRWVVPTIVWIVFSCSMDVVVHRHEDDALIEVLQLSFELILHPFWTSRSRSSDECPGKIFWNRQQSLCPLVSLWMALETGPQILGAHGLRSWGLVCWITRSDGPLRSQILMWRDAHFVNCPLRLGPKSFVPSVKSLRISAAPRPG